MPHHEMSCGVRVIPASSINTSQLPGPRDDDDDAEDVDE